MPEGTLFNRILVPTDFSERAAAAIRSANLLSRALGAEAVLLHVIETKGSPLGESGKSGDLATARTQAEDRLVALAAGHFADTDEVSTFVQVGDAAEQILKAAEELSCNLIILSPHKRGRLAQALRDSTAERILRLAHCAVLTLRDNDR